MKKQQHETFKTRNRKSLNKDHFDWLLFAFLTIVIILLVCAISA